MSEIRGGKRKGAGRPPGTDNKERVTIRLPVWLKVWLKEQPESQAVLIEEALLKCHFLPFPKIPK